VGSCGANVAVILSSGIESAGTRPALCNKKMMRSPQRRVPLSPHFCAIVISVAFESA
jgi:hypothetical protein